MCIGQEVGRLFCGKCGNAALQKVEVVVGPLGTEQYGVRKKHILRGTRFPLPKPKVRPHFAYFPFFIQARDPILVNETIE